MVISENTDSNDKLKYIYWFAYYNLKSPSVRYRAKYPLDYLLKNYGIKSSLIIPGYGLKQILAFIHAYFSAVFFQKKGSIVVIQRIHSNFIYANLLKLLVRIKKERTIYDIDDADYLEIPSKTIYFFIKNCSAVMVGSHELAENLSKYNSHIILNTSPVPDLGIIKTNRNQVLRIGWIGGFGGDHKKSLEELLFPAVVSLPFPIVLSILGVYTNNDYKFLIAYFKEYPNIKLEIPFATDWTDEEAIQKKIVGFDIGIATLFNHEMHRSKSAFKAKQYLNNGIPVLSSDIKE